MKYAILLTVFAATFASCAKKDAQYNWVCTTDKVYVDLYGEQHLIKRTTVRFKTKDEIKLVEKEMGASCKK